MPNRIILKDTDLDAVSNPPSGYKFLGFDNGELSEKSDGVVRRISDKEWIGVLNLIESGEGFSVMKNTLPFQFNSPVFNGNGFYNLPSTDTIIPNNIHVITTPLNTPNKLTISSINSNGIIFEILDSQGSATASGDFHVQIKYFV